MDRLWNAMVQRFGLQGAIAMVVAFFFVAPGLLCCVLGMLWAGAREGMQLADGDPVSGAVFMGTALAIVVGVLGYFIAVPVIGIMTGRHQSQSRQAAENARRKLDEDSVEGGVDSDESTTEPGPRPGT